MHMAHVLVGFVEVAVDGRVPVVGFILNMNIGRMQCEFNFAKDSTVTVYLLQCNKTFTIYITISSLSLVHDDIPEKIMYLPFVVIRPTFINSLFPVH